MRLLGVCQFKKLTVFTLGICLALPYFVFAQSPKPETPNPQVSSSVLSLENLPEQIEASKNRLLAIKKDFSLEVKEQNLAEPLEKITSLVDEKTKSLKAIFPRRLRPYILRGLESQWEDLNLRAKRLEGQVKEYSEKIKIWLEEVNQQKEYWTKASQDLKKQGLSESLQKDINTLLKHLNEAQVSLDKIRLNNINLLNQVSLQKRPITYALELIDGAQSHIFQSLFLKEAISWDKIYLLSPSFKEEMKEVSDAVGFSNSNVLSYLKKFVFRFIFQVLVFGLFYIIFSKTKNYLASNLGQKVQGRLEAHQAVLFYPWAAAWMFVVLLSRYFHPHAPGGLVFIFSVLALPAWVVILKKILPQNLRSVLVGFLFLLALEYIRIFFDDLPLLSNLVLLIQLCWGLVWALVWSLKKTSNNIFAKRDLPLIYRIFRDLVYLCSGAFGAGVLTWLLSYLNFADLMAQLAVNSIFFGSIYLILVLIIESLIKALLFAGKLNRFNIIRKHPISFLSKAQAALRAVAILLWIQGVLASVLLWKPFWSLINSVLSAQFGYGSFIFSLGSLLTFGLSLYLSWIVARFAGFFLNEEVFPRFKLPPGIPFALSTFTRYIIMVVGILVALSILGFTVDSIVLLFGALGVGIGFGLQNLVNNFVSGLILLIERPIRLGDKVEVGSLYGVVTKIGIRASRVRTLAGADVLVPNGEFISAQVINWTLSDKRRRINLPIGVSYGSDPNRVIQLLEGVAKEHPRVLKDPPVEVLFMAFGDSSLDFELRAWTDLEREWIKVQSELAVAVNEALIKEGITVPFPQRDLHLKTVPPGIIKQ